MQDILGHLLGPLSKVDLGVLASATFPCQKDIATRKKETQKTNNLCHDKYIVCFSHMTQVKNF